MVVVAGSVFLSQLKISETQAPLLHMTGSADGQVAGLVDAGTQVFGGAVGSVDGTIPQYIDEGRQVPSKQRNGESPPQLYGADGQFSRERTQAPDSHM